MRPEDVHFDPVPNKFAPKLTFADQCAYFALHHVKGVSVGILAAAANIHKATMGKLVSKTHKRYQKVAKEAYSMGDERFFDTYVGNRHIEAVQKALKEQTARVMHPGKMEAPSKAHNKHVGIHAILDLKGIMQHIGINWFDDVDGCGPGYYYQDPEFGHAWTANSDTGKPFNTSTDCFRYIQAINGH